jgi:hypothetical protein
LAFDLHLISGVAASALVDVGGPSRASLRWADQVFQQSCSTLGFLGSAKWSTPGLSVMSLAEPRFVSVISWR